MKIILTSYIILAVNFILYCLIFYIIHIIKVCKLINENELFILQYNKKHKPNNSRFKNSNTNLKNILISFLIFLIPLIGTLTFFIFSIFNIYKLIIKKTKENEFNKSNLKIGYLGNLNLEKLKSDCYKYNKRSYSWTLRRLEKYNNNNTGLKITTTNNYDNFETYCEKDILTFNNKNKSSNILSELILFDLEIGNFLTENTKDKIITYTYNNFKKIDDNNIIITIVKIKERKIISIKFALMDNYGYKTKYLEIYNEYSVIECYFKKYEDYIKYSYDKVAQKVKIYVKEYEKVGDSFSSKELDSISRTHILNWNEKVLNFNSNILNQLPKLIDYTNEISCDNIDSDSLLKETLKILIPELAILFSRINDNPYFEEIQIKQNHIINEWMLYMNPDLEKYFNK